MKQQALPANVICPVNNSLRSRNMGGRTQNKTHQRSLAAVQQIGTLRIAILVIAGMIPIDFLAQEKKEVFHMRHDVIKAIAKDEKWLPGLLRLRYEDTFE